MAEDTPRNEQLAEQPSAADATEQSALPENFEKDGTNIVEELSKLIQGMPVLTVASAFTATLFSVATLESLEKEAREAISIMVYDLGQNVLRANGISEERMNELMADRGALYIDANENADGHPG